MSPDTCESSPGVWVAGQQEKKKVECAWLLLLSYASGLLASSSDSQSSTLVASGVLALGALLLCLARAPALLTRPPAETEHKKQKKVRCAWLLLLSNPSSLLASLALYSLPSYHSGSSALVASGVFGLEAVSGLHMLLLCSQARLLLSPRLASLSICPLSGVDCLSPFRCRLFLANYSLWHAV